MASYDYFYMLISLINSARINFAEALPYIALINLSQEQEKILKKINCNVECINEKVKFDNIYQQQIFCVNYRAGMIKKARKKYPNDVLLWMDSDSIIRKNVQAFRDQMLMDDYDIMARVRKRNKGKLPKIIAAIFAVNNTERGNILIEEYNKSINIDAYKIVKNKISKDNNNWQLWIQTQNNLMKIFTEIKDLKYKMIEEEFFDVNFNEDTCIWNALADGRNDYKFIEESKKYRENKKWQKQ